MTLRSSQKGHGDIEELTNGLKASRRMNTPMMKRDGQQQMLVNYVRTSEGGFSALASSNRVKTAVEGRGRNNTNDKTRN